MKRLFIWLLILLPILAYGQARRAVPFRDIAIERGREYNVTHGKYGAIPDDGLCDLDEIQVALDSINSHGGGTLLVPPGVFSYDSDNGDLRVYDNTTVKLMNGAKFDQIKGGGRLFYTDGGSDITFMGGEVDGNAINDGNYTESDMAISIINAFRVLVTDMYMHNMSGDGVYVSDSDDVIITNCIIDNPHVVDSPYIGRNGVAVVEGSRIIISNNHFDECAPGAIDIEPNSGLITEFINITGNVVNGSDDIGISLNNSAGGGSAVRDINVSHNIVTGTTTAGIRTDLATRVNITGNNVSSTTTIGIQVTSGNLDVLVEGNTIYAATTNGIETNSGGQNISIIGNKVYFCTSGGILINGTSGSENKNYTIMNNIVFDNSQGTDNTSDGIQASYTDRLMVANNFVYTSSSVNKHHRYGIRITNSDSVSYMNNVSYDAGTADHSSATVTLLDYSHNTAGATATENNAHSNFRAFTGTDFELRLNTGQSFMVDNASGSAMFTVSATGELTLATITKGTGTFTTTAVTDTVTISGAVAGDEYLLSPKGTAADTDSDDLLYWEARSGELVVHRPAGGTSALVYTWLRIK